MVWAGAQSYSKLGCLFQLVLYTEQWERSSLSISPCLSRDLEPSQQTIAEFLAKWTLDGSKPHDFAAKSHLSFPFPRSSWSLRRLRSPENCVRAASLWRSSPFPRAASSPAAVPPLWPQPAWSQDGSSHGQNPTNADVMMLEPVSSWDFMGVFMVI